MWERYCYAKGWCRLKLQINKEPMYNHYIGVLRHTGRAQKTHKRSWKNYTLHTYHWPSKPGFEVLEWEGLSGGCRARLAIERCSQLAVVAIQTAD